MEKEQLIKFIEEYISYSAYTYVNHELDINNYINYEYYHNGKFDMNDFVVFGKDAVNRFVIKGNHITDILDILIESYKLDATEVKDLFKVESEDTFDYLRYKNLNDICEKVINEYFTSLKIQIKDVRTYYHKQDQRTYTFADGFEIMDIMRLLEEIGFVSDYKSCYRKRIPGKWWDGDMKIGNIYFKASIVGRIVNLNKYKNSEITESMNLAYNNNKLQDIVKIFIESSESYTQF